MWNRACDIVFTGYNLQILGIVFAENFCICDVMFDEEGGTVSSGDEYFIHKM